MVRAAGLVEGASMLTKDSDQKSIVILTGPVGAGKTTVARHLVASSRGACAFIEGDVFWSFIAKRSPRSELRENFKMIMRAMSATARHYARDGYEVILDFSIPPWYLDGIRALLSGKPFHYIVLLPSEEICETRAASRSEGPITDYTAYRDLYAEFEKVQKRAIVPDASESAENIARRVRAGVDAGAYILE
jgi:chloramphenicol 3-O-phosphotransferase